MLALFSVTTLGMARCPPPMMGGLTGLPRIPSKGLALTKKFNKGGSARAIVPVVRLCLLSCRCVPPVVPLTYSCCPSRSVYTEPIATLWRDLETLYGFEGVVTGGSRGGSFRDTSRAGRGENTGKFRGLTYSVDQRAETVFKAVKKYPDLLNPAVSNRFTFATSKTILVEKLGSEKAAISLMLQDPSILNEGEALYDKSAGQLQTAALTKAAGPPMMFSALVAAAAVVANEQLGLGLTAGLSL